MSMITGAEFAQEAPGGNLLGDCVSYFLQFVSCQSHELKFLSHTSPTEVGIK